MIINELLEYFYVFFFDKNFYFETIRLERVQTSLNPVRFKLGFIRSGPKTTLI